MNKKGIKVHTPRQASLWTPAEGYAPVKFY